ncbi:MAG: NAD(+) synthase [Acidobacteria bacterium]|nr:NAD(+) synthase [Acidobacteriota bacterium]MBI3265002.1 NAD(+) synthase [Acidobacteriota bacterium]
MDAARAQGLVVGMSGGVDSAVVARLSQMAASDRVLGVILPCHSDPRDERDAMTVAAHFGLATIKVDLADPYDALLARASVALQTTPPRLGPETPPHDPRSRLGSANLKPRLRMATLYLVANSRNCLVVGTGNRSELAAGYFTKYGDGGVDLLPLGSLVKSEVRGLARALGVPAPIIEKPPSAGLWQGQADEAEMGFTYDELEAYLAGGTSKVSSEVAARVDRLAAASEHKRSLPPVFERP